MKTYLPKDDPNARKWHVIDANGVVLGRLATLVANVLRGKNKPTFTPHLDAGDFVVVINAEKVRVTGNKESGKSYMTYSGWKGGEKHESLEHLRARHPEVIIERAVWGMIPKNRLGRQLITKLKVYKGNDHLNKAGVFKHAAQKPASLAVAA